MRWPKIHKRALEATIAGEIPTDARRTLSGPARKVPDEETRRRSRFHRRVAAFVIAVIFVVGGVLALLGKGGFLELRQLERQRDAALGELQQQQERVEQARASVDRLRHGSSALERIAREELGYARPGEVTFVLPEEERIAGSAAEDGSGTD